MQCDGVPGIQYKAETAPRLTAPWTPAATNTPVADGPVTFTNDTPAAGGFYRIKGRAVF